MSEDGNNQGMLYLLAGCAVLVVLALCGVTGVGVWLFYSTEEAVVVSPPTPLPPPTPIPPPGPGPQLPAPPESPRIVTAVVTSVTGTAPVPEGATCGFSVERAPNGGGYWCKTQIVCAGRPLYGNGPQNGFFDCTLHQQPRRDIVGSDTQTTARDTDASMEIDTQANTLRIRDDASGPHGAYTLDARITDVR